MYKNHNKHFVSVSAVSLPISISITTNGDHIVRSKEHEEWVFPKRHNRFRRSATIYGKGKGTNHLKCYGTQRLPCVQTPEMKDEDFIIFLRSKNPTRCQM